MTAANPWSGLNHGASQKGQSPSPWSYEYPKWLPVDVFRGIPLNLDDLAAIKKSFTGESAPGIM
jgi:hypothetical protein